jgi:hypothetical protein
MPETDIDEHSDDKERYQAADRALQVLKKEVERNPFAPFAIVFVVVIFAVMTPREMFDRPIEAAECLFTGLAFAGVIMSLWHQGREMALQREELKLQRKELRLQRKEMELQREEMRRQEEEMHASATALMQASYLNVLGIYTESVRIQLEDARHSDVETLNAVAFKYGKLLREAEVGLERMRVAAVADVHGVRPQLHRFFIDIVSELSKCYGKNVTRTFAASVLEDQGEFARQMSDIPVISVDERIGWHSMYATINKMKDALYSIHPSNLQDVRRLEEVYRTCVSVLNDFGMSLPNPVNVRIELGQVVAQTISLDLPPT